MNLIRIGIFTVDEDLLEAEGYVLDVRCRGSGFACALAARNMYVLALDPEKTIVEPEISRVIRDTSEFGSVDISKLMQQHDIDFFEVVKMVCKNEEYDILRNWPGPVTRQLTLSHTRRFDDEIIEHLGQWYRWVQTEKFSLVLSPSDPMNYWDSLFVLR